MSVDRDAKVAEFLKFVDRYQNDRVLFVREVLNAEPQAWQIDVLKAADRGERRIAIRSGHRVGKSTLLAWLMLHHVLTKFPQKTGVTAPSEKQLFDALWAEFKAWAGKLKPSLQEAIRVTQDRCEFTEAPAESFISIKVARPENTEALHGMYSENVLLIADEASGVSDAHFEAAMSSLANPHVLFIITGNPTRKSGFFSDAFHKQPDLWWPKHVRSLDSPFAHADYINFVKTKYGEDSNAYRIRVLGEFPTAEDDKVVPRDLIEAAVDREVEAPRSAPVVWGVDVGYVARSALAKRRINVLLEPVRSWRKLDTMETAGRVKHEWDVTPEADRPVAICVDSIGIGRGVSDRLRELGLPVRAINVSESPALNNAQYKDLRSELWFQVRQWLAQRDSRIPNQEELIDELAEPNVVYYDSSGKTGAETKKALKSRGVESPDLADAVCLTFAVDATVLAGSVKRQRGGAVVRPIRGLV